jgi:hypothetical protein
VLLNHPVERLTQRHPPLVLCDGLRLGGGPRDLPHVPQIEAHRAVYEILQTGLAELESVG